jgi:pilus assembly protein Flp/PilA
MNRLLRFLRDDSGPTAVEYAVMLAMIIGVCIVAIGYFGTSAGGSWQDTSTKLTFMGGSSS